MKLLWGAKDGGPESRVWVWGFEWKSGFSVLLMNFKKGSREAYHTHAFNAWSVVLCGWLREHEIGRGHHTLYGPGTPVTTRRRTYHRVEGVRNNNWVLSFRGPWVDTWKDNPGVEATLTHGRVEVETKNRILEKRI